MSPRLSASDLVLRAQTDARLASLAAGGHERAFALLVERHSELLSTIARRIVGAEHSEDVVQQALLRAWRALRTQTEVRNVAAWLSQIVRNVALTEYARQRSTPETLSPNLPDPRTVAGSVEQRFDMQEVIAGLAALPDAQRWALLATEFEGRSRHQIATELGLSQGAVRQLVHRARSAMRVIVTAVTPYPVIDWLARRGAAETAAAGSAVGGSSAVTGGTALGGGSALGGGALVKGGATILAVTAVAGGGLAFHAALRHVGRSPHHHLRAGARPAVDRDHSAVVTLAAAPPASSVAALVSKAPSVGRVRAARHRAGRRDEPARERNHSGGSSEGDSGPSASPQTAPSQTSAAPAAPIGGGDATTASMPDDNTSSHADDQSGSGTDHSTNGESGTVTPAAQPTPTTAQPTPTTAQPTPTTAQPTPTTGGDE